MGCNFDATEAQADGVALRTTAAAGERGERRRQALIQNERRSLKVRKLSAQHRALALSSVHEPSTMLLLGTGLTGFLSYGRRRNTLAAYETSRASTHNIAPVTAG